MYDEINSSDLLLTDVTLSAEPQKLSARFARVLRQDGPYWHLSVSRGPRPPTDDEVFPFIRTFFGDDSPCEELVDNPTVRQFVAPIRTGETGQSR